MISISTARRRTFLGYLFLISCFPLACNRSAPPEGGSEDHPANVSVENAVSEKVDEWTSLLGTTQPLTGSVARATAQVEGRVISSLRPSWFSRIVEGRHVQAGQVLVQLDDRAARANRARLAATVADVDEQDKQAGIAEERAELDVNSLKGLRKDGPTGIPMLQVPQIEIDKAVLAYKEAQSKRRAVAARKASLAAELETLDIQLEYYTIRAPISGTLGQFQVTPGQNLAIGTTVADVVDLDEVDVLCAVPPHTAAHLELGQKARLADRPEVEGSVVYIAVQAQAETGNYTVKVRFPNQDDKLRLNAVVRVQVQTQPERERWLIPETAVLEDQEPPAVIVVGKKAEEGKEEKVVARILLVELGVRDRQKHKVEVVHLKSPDKGEVKGEEVEIKGVKFITKGAHGLKDEDEVKVEEEEPKEHK